MARGSGGGGGGGGASHTGIEMQGEGGGIDAHGKTTLSKKYFVTNASELESAPVINGYHAVSINYNRLNATAYEQTVTYEAQSDASGAGTTVWLQNGVKGTFEMFCSFESKVIALHPRIKSIMKKYQGFPEGATISFPFYYIDGEATALSNTKPQKNPMYGVTRFKEPSMVLRHTYFSKTVSQSIWSNSGKIVTSLPAGIPVPKGDIDDEGKEIKRRWMMQHPAISRQGEAWQVIQEYVLLDATGVADEVYIFGTVPGVV